MLYWDGHLPIINSGTDKLEQLYKFTQIFAPWSAKKAEF